MDAGKIARILDQANELLEAGKAAETLHILRRLDGARLEAEDEIEYAALKGWALSELGRHREALEVVEPVLEEQPESARLRGTRGVILSNAGAYEEACAELEEACRLDGEDEVAVANLALVYEKLREYDRALELYEQAINMGADIDWLLQRKAAVHNELGELKAAKATLSRYLSLEPDDAQQWVNLAVLHSDEQEYQQAFSCYRAAEQVAPDSVSLRLNWGVTAVRAGQLDVAQQQLRYLERLEPERTRPWLLRAFIFEEEGDAQKALGAYEQALRVLHGDDAEEVTYALEMAMDFASRHEMTAWCQALFEQAYRANACSVELCEAHREATGPHHDRATWFSVLVEADYRPGLVEVPDRESERTGRYTRYLRNVQVVAADRDDAAACITDTLHRFGEQDACIREFVSEEPIEDTYAGLYEIDRQCLVFNDEEE